MSLFKIAWRSIQRRGLASLLTSLSMALGVLMVVAVLLILGIVTESFRSNSSLGYNMIVGAKGGDLQLVLNTVYYLSSPVENIPYTYYQEFLSASERGDGRDGKYQKFVEFVIPLCLGDYYAGYRVVGTTPQLFDNFVYDAERGRKYEFSAGRNFEVYNRDHGFFEAVVGAHVAREQKIKPGDHISPTHGSPDGDVHDYFVVTGVLAPSGTPSDRAVFANLEGFLLLEGHAKPVEDPEAAAKLPLPPPLAELLPENFDDPAQLPAKLEANRAALRPLPIAEREVTALLVRTVSPLVTPSLRNGINEGLVGRAVLPIIEIHMLFKTLVTPIKVVLLILTIMICVVSGVSILVSIYNSMNDRQHEIAVMRALGAGRRTVLTVILLEAVILALAGGMLGWAAGHLVIGGLASGEIERRTGVEIGVFDFAPVVRPFQNLGDTPLAEWSISPEFLLIPGLILLAIIVGFLPALAAYRTDVGKALSATP